MSHCGTAAAGRADLAKRRAGRSAAAYRSSMCSTAEDGRPRPEADAAALDRLGSAIDELAGAAGDPQGPATAERLARVWGMLAELDPELARRMAGYDG
jgi:hypothetical protein